MVPVDAQLKALQTELIAMKNVEEADGLGVTENVDDLTEFLRAHSSLACSADVDEASEKHHKHIRSYQKETTLQVLNRTRVWKSQAETTITGLSWAFYSQGPVW